MSFISPKDFAGQYGLKYATLRSHISRGKVLKVSGFIDTDNPVNRLYIQENAVKETIAPPKKTTNDEITTNSKPPKETYRTDSAPGSDETNLTLRKKRADALKSERDAEIKSLTIQKLQGRLMPIDLVEKTQTINIQSIFRAFESAAENIASIYTERLGGDRADLADMITRMRQELHRSIQDAKEKSKQEIKGLMAEYADTRSRGEKK
jgi:hypothetical protein